MHTPNILDHVPLFVEQDQLGEIHTPIFDSKSDSFRVLSPFVVALESLLEGPSEVTVSHFSDTLIVSGFGGSSRQTEAQCIPPRRVV